MRFRVEQRPSRKAEAGIGDRMECLQLSDELKQTYHSYLKKYKKIEAKVHASV